MNLIAMIGIIDEINLVDKNITNLSLKVEKPFLYGDLNEEYYDFIPIELNNIVFKKQLNSITKGDLIGFKGRLRSDNQTIRVIAEKIQLF